MCIPWHAGLSPGLNVPRLPRVRRAKWRQSSWAFRTPHEEAWGRRWEAFTSAFSGSLTLRTSHKVTWEQAVKVWIPSPTLNLLDWQVSRYEAQESTFWKGPNPSPINSHESQPKFGKHWDPFLFFLIRVTVELYPNRDVWDPPLNVLNQYQQSRDQRHLSYLCIFLVLKVILLCSSSLTFGSMFLKLVCHLKSSEKCHKMKISRFCTFWFVRSRMRPRNLHFDHLPVIWMQVVLKTYCGKTQLQALTSNHISMRFLWYTATLLLELEELYVRILV